MQKLTEYNGVQIVTPDPQDEGGLALNGNFKALSTHIDSVDPAAGNDVTQGYSAGSRWFNSTTSADPTSPQYGQFSPTGSGFTAHVPMRPGPGGAVRPGWFTNLFQYNILDCKTQDDIDATGSTPSNLITQYQYDPNGNLIRLTKPMGNTVEYDYDERDLRIALRIGFDSASGALVNGAITIWSYDGNGNVINVIGPVARGTADNSKTATINDAFSGDVPFTQTGDWVTENTYDGFDRLVTATDALGNVISNTFDPGSRTIETTVNGPAGGSPPADRAGTNNVPLSYGATLFDEAGRAYDSLANVFLNTDKVSGVVIHTVPSTRAVTHTGGGLATNSTINNHTSAVSLTGGLVSYALTRTVYDQAGRIVATATDNAAVTTVAYDGASRQILVTDPLSNSIATLYDNNGNATQVTRTDVYTGGTVPSEIFLSATFYDCLNRPTVSAMQGPDGTFVPSRCLLAAVTWNTFAVSGPPWRTETGTTFSFTGYDSRRNRSVSIDPNANSTLSVYDGANRSIETQQFMRLNGDGGNGPEAGGSFQAASQAVIRTKNVYDSNGRVTALIDDRGAQTSYQYDLLDRQTSMTFQDGSSRSSVYDLDNDLTGYTDENGSVFANTYDSLGRRSATAITRATAVGGTTAQSFQYDGLSRLTFAKDTDGSTDVDVTFFYDSLGRMIEESQFVNTDTAVPTLYVTHTQFVSIPIAELTYPNDRTVSYLYDTLYRRNQVQETSGATNIITWEFFGYRTARMLLGNGVIGTFMNDAGTRSAVQTGQPTPGWGSLYTDRLEIEKRDRSNIDVIAAF